MSEPKHTVVVGGLVRDGKGRVLLIRHHLRGWEIPQGRVEEGEGLAAALHREVREETGAEVAIGPLVAVYSKLSAPSAVSRIRMVRRSRSERSCSMKPSSSSFLRL